MLCSVPEIQIVPDRVRAASLGLAAQDIGQVVDTLLDGRKVSDYQHEGKEIDLTLMGRSSYTQRTQDFEDLLLRTPDGHLVTLGSLADVRWVAGPTQINHIERQRAITIQVRPPRETPLETAMQILETQVIEPLKQSGEAGGIYNVNLAGTADDLVVTSLDIDIDEHAEGVVAVDGDRGAGREQLRLHQHRCGSGSQARMAITLMGSPCFYLP